MNSETAEIIASAIRDVGHEIGTGTAQGSPGGLELLAESIRQGSAEIASAIHDLAEAVRERH